MNIPEIKEILRQSSVEVDIQGRKHLALFESDFERVAIELVEELTKQLKALKDGKNGEGMDLVRGFNKAFRTKCYCTKSEKYYDPIGDIERCQKCEKAL